MTSLNRSWTLYFHAKDKTQNYDNNTIKIMDIHTIEEFWGCFNFTPKPCELFYDGYIQKALKIKNREKVKLRVKYIYQTLGLFSNRV